MAEKPRVLVIGAGFSGLLVARDLRKLAHVTVVDAKEYFEYTPGILRAYVKPEHYDELSFQLHPVLERKMGVRFVWGECTNICQKSKTAAVRLICTGQIDVVPFDYCVIAAGCNFGPFKSFGASLWFPTIHSDAIKASDWGHLDERYIEGRRRHIFEEYHRLSKLNKAKAKILIVGAGFIGVEWATELQCYFSNLQITLIDFLPRPLGPLPDNAAEYCQNYLEKVKIKTFYNVKYEPESKEFWEKIELPDGADDTFVCIGVKASNYFMPEDTLSTHGPGGGGWILMNKKLQVTTRKDEIWGDGSIFAIGDCNYGCIGSPDNWIIPPIPKISFPSEEQGAHVVKNIKILEKQKHGKLSIMRPLMDTWWPWGAGMFATSLGPKDACFVLGANHEKNSGKLCFWKGRLSSIQKDIIESTKVDECKMGLIGRATWHYVHHTPINLWGKGPLFM